MYNRRHHILAKQHHRLAKRVRLSRHAQIAPGTKEKQRASRRDVGKGKDEGEGKGFAKGWETGNAEGKGKGFNKGWEKGWDEGRGKGFAKGWAKGSRDLMTLVNQVSMDTQDDYSVDSAHGDYGDDGL